MPKERIIGVQNRGLAMEIYKRAPEFELMGKQLEGNDVSIGTWIYIQ